MATNILQTCYESNPDDAQLILLRGVNEFNNVTPLQISEFADSKSFLSSVPCQSLLAKIWYGQIFIDAPKIYVLEGFIQYLIYNITDE